MYKMESCTEKTSFFIFKNLYYVILHKFFLITKLFTLKSTA